MKLCVVAVYDSAAQAFGRPIFVAAVGQAVRSFQDEVTRGGDSEMSKHPDDFTLYHLGSFDDNLGSFEQGSPTILIRGKDAALKSE